MQLSEMHNRAGKNNTDSYLAVRTQKTTHITLQLP